MHYDVTMYWKIDKYFPLKGLVNSLHSAKSS